MSMCAQSHQIVAHGDETGAEIVGIHHAISLLMRDRHVIIIDAAYTTYTQRNRSCQD